MKAHITIRDIAKRLNVSVSTVSRALSNHPAINKDTKRLVVEMAKELNYQPNSVAQNFRMSKTFNLGIIVPDLVTHFFSATISGMQSVATRAGYNVMICQSNESFETEVKNVNTLVSSRVDGIMMSLSKETTTYDHIQAIHERGMPIVLFDRICEDIDISKVTVDDHDGAYNATDHLLKSGYQRIAHISGPEKLSISKRRMQGYIDALAANNIAIREDYIVNSTLEKEDIKTKALELLDLPKPPDAIFAINDPTAVQVMLLLKEKKIKMPEEMGIIGFNNEPVSGLIEPSLSTVEQPAYQIGMLAAKQLIDQIDHPDDFIPQKTELKTRLVIRDSSKKKKV